MIGLCVSIVYVEDTKQFELFPLHHTIFLTSMDANTLTPSNDPPEGSRVTASAVDTSIELANTVVAIVKEVGEMLDHVPYVKSLSGVILQIIRVRDVRR